jgi:hypothetical protein
MEDGLQDKEAIKILESVSSSSNQEEVLEGVSKLMQDKTENDKIQHLASKTLANMAADKDGALKLANHGELRRSLSNVLKSGKNPAKLEAARAINNAIMVSPDAAQAIHSDEDTMNSLKSLCGSSDSALRLKGFQTLTNMSVFPDGAKAINEHGLIDSVVVPVLGEKKGLFGNKDQHEATRFLALSLLANCDRLDKMDTANTKDIKLFHSVLKAGLDHKKWAGQDWSCYQALNPLGRMTTVKLLHQGFKEAKIIKLLAQCLLASSGLSKVELMVSCFCLVNLSENADCKASIQKKKYDILAQLKRLESSSSSVKPHARAVRKKAFEEASAAPTEGPLDNHPEAGSEGHNDSTSDDHTESEDKKDQSCDKSEPESDPDANKDQE